VPPKVHICEECGREYLAERYDQRWCDEWCREQFRNAELRAARKLYAQWKQSKRVSEENGNESRAEGRSA
jgi:hypothetical protein